MGLAKLFQKIKWERLAKKDANFYILSDKEIARQEQNYRQSGKKDVERLILKDKLLEAVMKDSQRKNCLEFGCGNGRMTEFLAGIFKQVWAVDISLEMLKQAKQRLAGLDNIVYLQSAGGKIGLPDLSVDFVFSYLVLQHLPAKRMVEQAFGEFYRILKKGGWVKLQVRGRQAVGGFFRFFKWYFGVYFSGQELTEILKKIGFSIISSQGQETKLFWLWLKK